MNGNIDKALHGAKRIHLDSNVIIYFIENNPTYTPLVRVLFEHVAQGRLEGISSYITLLEVLILPIKQHRLDLAQQYKNILVTSPHFQLFPVDRHIAERGAEIRAKYAGIRTPDAIQLATAIQHGADLFVTNDAHFSQFPEIRVLMLDAFLS